MRKDLEENKAKVKNYDDMFNSKDPAYASLLLKRIFILLQNDTHMLWKILQENLGRDWFHRPVLHRNLNYKYHIDYEPFDSIIGEVAKIVIGNQPQDATKIASSQDCLVLSYMVDAFHNQKAHFLKEISRKDQFEQKLLDSKEESKRGDLVHGEDTIMSSRQGRIPSTLSNQSPDFELSNEHGNSRESHYQGLVRMLLTELGNTRSEKLAISSNYEVLRGEYSLLERFLHELADAAGVVKDGVAIIKLLGKLKKLDQATLGKSNFSKIIAMGKTDLIAKTALMVQRYY